MIEAFCDGACRGGNPGICSCAWVLRGETFDEHDNLVLAIDTYDQYFLGPELHTNNYAEYQGLIRLLKFLYKAHLRNVVIYCDSLLVVNQVNDVWDVNSPDLLPYWQLAYGMVMQGCHVLKHIKGHDGKVGNEEADRLCNEELDRQEEHVKTMGSNNKQTQS